MYFTQEHEDAIVEYCLEHTTFERRSRLYEDLIQPAFSEMVDKIVYTYRFTTLPNIDELRDDCKIWLTTILAKYDPNRGSKAFSYFSVITKNWFIHQVKKNSKRARREVDYDKAQNEIEKVMRTSDDSYLYLREITGLNTKQIVSQLNKMRKKYRNFKYRWDNNKFD